MLKSLELLYDGVNVASSAGLKITVMYVQDGLHARPCPFYPAINSSWDVVACIEDAMPVQVDVRVNENNAHCLGC